MLESEDVAWAFERFRSAEYLPEEEITRLMELPMDAELSDADAEKMALLQDELLAFATENALGTRSFMERLIRSDRTAAERMLNAVSDVLEALKAGKDPVTKAALRKMRARQNAFIHAVEESGFRYEGRKIFAVKGEEEEADEVRKAKPVKRTITTEDIQILRGFRRKSITSFSSEETKKAQKWAEKYMEDFKEKKVNPCISPFFRAWFGEWRANEKTEIQVADIPEYVNSNEARKTNRGVCVNSDTKWEIDISREGETNTISHAGAQRKSEFGLAGIRGLVENAVLLDTEIHDPHQNNAKVDLIAFDHKLYSLGKDTNEQIGLYRITVEEYYQDPNHANKKRFHNQKYIEKVADLSVDALAKLIRSHGSAIDKPTTAYSIADLYAFVKAFDEEFHVGKPVSEKMLNKDGTPKVFYHGTNGDFTVFDKKKIGSASEEDHRTIISRLRICWRISRRL